VVPAWLGRPMTPDTGGHTRGFPWPTGFLHPSAEFVSEPQRRAVTASGDAALELHAGCHDEATLSGRQHVTTDTNKMSCMAFKSALASDRVAPCATAPGTRWQHSTIR